LIPINDAHCTTSADEDKAAQTLFRLIYSYLFHQALTQLWPFMLYDKQEMADLTAPCTLLSDTQTGFAKVQFFPSCLKLCFQLRSKIHWGWFTDPSIHGV